MRNWRKKNGITLIALIVTIIVLLILAGISISMISGNNGIINKAIEAREQTEDANDLEYLRTEAYGELIEYYSSGSSLSEQDYVLQKLGEKEGFSVNQIAGTITYNGKTYNISELLGNSNEQNSIANNGLTQIIDSPLITESSNIRMVLQEETESGTLQAVIPAGFYYVMGKPSTGLVISDVQGDDDQNTKGGNQFVWVPCNQEGAVNYAKHTYADPSKDDTTGSMADTGNGNWKTYQYRNYNDWTDDGGNEESVEKYGGFYIARYEAGALANAPFYNDTDHSTYWQTYYDEDVSTIYGSNSLTSDGLITNYAETYMGKNVTNYIPISKKNTPAWNFITQEAAKIVSGKMYASSSSVTSSLVDSYAWDTTTQWLSNSGYNVTDSTEWGNYYNASFSINGLYARHEYKTAIDSIDRWFPAYYYNYGIYERSNSERTETSTGSVERNKANNIYDLAGNMYEWTTETGKHNGNTTYAVRCGGSFSDVGSDISVCCRNGSHASGWVNLHVGFRVVLYLK